MGLGRDDPLVYEWSVIVWGAGYHGALVARDLGDDDVPDMERRFAYAITHDADRSTHVWSGKPNVVVARSPA